MSITAANNAVPTIPTPRQLRAGSFNDAGELHVQQLQAPAQDLDLHFAFQIKRIAIISELAPVPGVTRLWVGAATGRAPRRLGRDGDRPAPREDSVAVKATTGGDQTFQPISKVTSLEKLTIGGAEGINRKELSGRRCS